MHVLQGEAESGSHACPTCTGERVQVLEPGPVCAGVPAGIAGVGGRQCAAAARWVFVVSFLILKNRVANVKCQDKQMSPAAHQHHFMLHLQETWKQAGDLWWVGTNEFNHVYCSDPASDNRTCLLQASKQVIRGWLRCITGPGANFKVYSWGLWTDPHERGENPLLSLLAAETRDPGVRMRNVGTYVLDTYGESAHGKTTDRYPFRKRALFHIFKAKLPV